MCGSRYRVHQALGSCGGSRPPSLLLSQAGSPGPCARSCLSLLFVRPLSTRLGRPASPALRRLVGWSQTRLCVCWAPGRVAPTARPGHGSMRPTTRRASLSLGSKWNAEPVGVADSKGVICWFRGPPAAADSSDAVASIRSPCGTDDAAVGVGAGVMQTRGEGPRGRGAGVEQNAHGDAHKLHLGDSSRLVSAGRPLQCP